MEHPPAAEPVIRIREPLPGEADALAGVQTTCWAETYAGRVPETFYDEAARERRRGMWDGLLASAELTEGNTRALGFYRHQGFAHDGATELDESFGPRELRMVR
ncbi:hypothetical protein [Nesterenkonia halobia]|uniref:GNAT family N-acetyltransferase n=1 Tax=Nesterenkonia halobia TaxID=37922 RepID=A0ABP6R9T4_9MICC